MEFRIGDLLVTLTSDEARDQVGRSPQRQCDYKTTCFVCTRIQVSRHGGQFEDSALLAQTDAEIEGLKAELRLTLAGIELEQRRLALAGLDPARAPTLEDEDGPSSLEEIDRLEGRLREALEELSVERNRRARAEG